MYLGIHRRILLYCNTWTKLFVAIVGIVIYCHKWLQTIWMFSIWYAFNVKCTFNTTLKAEKVAWRNVALINVPQITGIFLVRLFFLFLYLFIYLFVYYIYLFIFMCVCLWATFECDFYLNNYFFLFDFFRLRHLKRHTSSFKLETNFDNK